MPAVQDRPIHTKPKPATARPTNCVIDLDQPDGSAIAYVRIDPVVLTRLQKRAYKQDLALYCWENIFRKALETAVF
jgi:hypothetical protein